MSFAHSAQLQQVVCKYITYIHKIYVYFSVRVPTSSYSLILLYIRELYVPRVTVKHFNCQLYGVLRYTQNFSQRKLHTVGIYIHIYVCTCEYVSTRIVDTYINVR